MSYDFAIIYLYIENLILNFKNYFVLAFTFGRDKVCKRVLLFTRGGIYLSIHSFK